MKKQGQGRAGIVARPTMWSGAAMTLAAAGWMAGGNAGATDILRGPILQEPQGGIVVVAWETDLPAPGRLLWGTSGAMDEIADSPGIQQRHEVRLEGLVPGESVTYRVCSGTRHSRVRSFRVPPAAGQDVEFIVFGDTRSFPKPHRAIVEAAMKRTGDLLVNTGDMVEHGDSIGDWDAFFAVERPLLQSTVSFHVLGNHDRVGDGVEVFRRLFVLPESPHAPERDWVIDAGKVRIVGLDNAITSSMGAKQKAWLEEVLGEGEKAPGIEHQIVIVHHGLHSNGPHGPSKSLLEAGLDDVMRAHGVAMVIAGHDHGYERGVVDGLRYMVSAGGGAPLYKKFVDRGHALKREIVHHFVAFSTSGGDLSFEVVLVDGSVLEACKLVKGPKAFDCK